MAKSNLFINYDVVLDEQLRDPEVAVAYLNEALSQSDEPELFFVALRNVARAYGMSNIAKRSNRNRESLYRTLSHRGHPQFDSILAVIGALGLKLMVNTQAKLHTKTGDRKKKAA
jgi:probable addiction module antidote protein